MFYEWILECTQTVESNEIIYTFILCPVWKRPNPQPVHVDGLETLGTGPSNTGILCVTRLELKYGFKCYFSISIGGKS